MASSMNRFAHTRFSYATDAKYQAPRLNFYASNMIAAGMSGSITAGVVIVRLAFWQICLKDLRLNPH